MPTILAGCSLGGALGNILEDWLGPSVHAPYSLMGAVALLGGIQRSPISLCVVILEGTGQVHWLLPIIVTTILSKWVGDRFSPSVYHAAIHLKKMPVVTREESSFLEDWLQSQTAESIMTPGPGRGEDAADAIMGLSGEEVAPPRGVLCLPLHAKVGTVVDMLSMSSCNGFPVVKTSKGGDRTLVGIVLREQLYALMRNRVWEASEDLLFLRRVGVAHAESAKAIADDINHAATVMEPGAGDTPTSGCLVAELGINPDVDPQWRHMWMDLSSLMNPTPYTVQAATPLPKVVELFCGMGLRHLPVIDCDGQVVGMITRKDLHDGIPALRMKVNAPELYGSSPTGASLFNEPDEVYAEMTETRSSAPSVQNKGGFRLWGGSHAGYGLVGAADAPDGSF